VESESLIALDRRTGKEVWRTRGVKESWSTPLIIELPGGGTELVVPVVNKVLGIDPADGKVLWSCATIPYYMCPSAAAHAGIVYITGGRERTTFAIRAGGRGDVTRTHLVWQVRKGSNVSSPVYHDGHLYLANDSPAVACCLDAKTGEVRYEERLPDGEIYASPVLAGGKLYYVMRHGTTHVVAAQPRFELLASSRLGDHARCNATPALAGGRLFLRTDRFLYCIGEPSCRRGNGDG
jgi:outer membrane protein assembly factor BamB